MHPLLHILPAMVCAVFAIAAWLEFRDNAGAGFTLTIADASRYAAMIVGATAAAGIALAPAITWGLTP